MKMLVTNDDGPFSLGLWLLYEAVKDLGEVCVVAPETPKSASGLGLTLHKPLRVNRLEINGVKVYLINGTPSDIVYVALNVITGPVDIVLSGINIGDNTSAQVILSSGTVGAALQAALAGIPGIAFSVAVDSPEKLEEKELSESIKRGVHVLVESVKEKGFPENIDVLNVNFPNALTNEFKAVPLAKLRYSNIIVKRTDPRGLHYYWLYGQPLKPEPGTDVYTILVEKKIAVTPISIQYLAKPLDAIKGFVAHLNSKMAKLKR